MSRDTLLERIPIREGVYKPGRRDLIGILLANLFPLWCIHFGVYRLIETGGAERIIAELLVLLLVGCTISILSFELLWRTVTRDGSRFSSIGRLKILIVEISESEIEKVLIRVSGFLYLEIEVNNKFKFVPINRATANEIRRNLSL